MDNLSTNLYDLLTTVGGHCAVIDAWPFSSLGRDDVAQLKLSARLIQKQVHLLLPEVEQLVAQEIKHDQHANGAAGKDDSQPSKRAKGARGRPRTDRKDAG